MLRASTPTIHQKHNQEISTLPTHCISFYLYLSIFLVSYTHYRWVFPHQRSKITPKPTFSEKELFSEWKNKFYRPKQKRQLKKSKPTQVNRIGWKNFKWSGIYIRLILFLNAIWLTLYKYLMFDYMYSYFGRKKYKIWNMLHWWNLFESTYRCKHFKLSWWNGPH